MAIENFYTITSDIKKEGGNTYEYKILINSDHPIFEGHFPGNPVMPGVCMMQIIKEITESVTGNKLFMNKCTNVKFLALINPENNPELTLDLQIKEQDGTVHVKNTTRFDDTLALRLSAHYQIK